MTPEPDSLASTRQGVFEQMSAIAGAFAAGRAAVMSAAPADADAGIPVPTSTTTALGTEEGAVRLFCCGRHFVLVFRDVRDGVRRRGELRM